MNLRYAKKIIFAMSVAFAGTMGTSLWALEFPDTVSVRIAHARYFQDTQVLKDKTRLKLSDPQSGRTVILAVSEGNQYWFVYFINGVDGRFDESNQGSCAIFIDKASGKIARLRLRLFSDAASYLDLLPGYEKTLMTLVVYGIVMQKDVPLGLSLEDAAVSSFAEIQNASEGRIAWEHWVNRLGDSEDAKVEQSAATIRSHLAGLKDVDDGALDADGRFVFIATLKDQGAKGGVNCSGFAKWVVDGFLRGAGREVSSVTELKTRHSGKRSNTITELYEDALDPFFGLDWTRNLALKSFGLEPARDDYRSRDVSDDAYFEYHSDSGYTVAQLKAFLRYQAAIRPGQYYLASISKPTGSETILYSHHHVAVLFPYFDKKGDFHCPVFERTKEISIDGFLLEWKGEFAHLVDLEARGEWSDPRD